MFMKPAQISIKDFSYTLPPERIAQYPLPERDQSKLLIYRDNQIQEDIYWNLDQYLPANSLLVFNNTKVLQARMFFENNKGIKIELFCLEPAEESDIVLAMNSCGTVRWKCLVGRASKWKEKTIRFTASGIELEAQIVGRTAGAFIIEFRWKPESMSFAEVLHLAGVMPIPPYLKRTSEELDQQRYQTVYAKEEGSVAAPTAGLHFTNRLFDKLAAKNIHPLYVTLHVGAGTFKPVKAEAMADHEMHSEFIEVRRPAILSLLASLGKPIVAVGTTSLRTIETLYWLGTKLILKKVEQEIPEVSQWEPYEFETAQIPLQQSLEALLQWLDEKKTERLICKTSLLIVPGYKLKLADAIITNFHQPESTLMLLVATVMGKGWRQVYQYALDNEFRFLSYGDGSLLFTNKTKQE